MNSSDTRTDLSCRSDALIREAGQLELFPLTDEEKAALKKAAHVKSSPESTQQVPPAAPPAPARPAGSWKHALLLGGAAVIFMVGGGAAYMLTRGPAPPSASEVNALVQANKNFVQAFTCLDNFNYGKSPVNISPWDTRTRSWMDALVQAGLYSGPTKVVDHGRLMQVHLQYAHTDSGKKAIRGTRLCYADGMAVDSVKYAAPSGNAFPPRVTGTAQYHLTNSADWISRPAVKEALPDRFNKTSMAFRVNFVLLDKKWLPLSDEAMARLEVATRPASEPAGAPPPVQAPAPQQLAAAPAQVAPPTEMPASASKPALASVAKSQQTLPLLKSSADKRGRKMQATRDRKLARRSAMPVARMVDDQYNARASRECERGISGLLCRESLKLTLCDGRWSEAPPPGQSLCKRFEQRQDPGAIY